MADLYCTLTNYTVCFPEKQVIPDTTTQKNPYYNFSMQQSVWTYMIGTCGRQICRVNIQICSQLNKQDLTIQNSYDSGLHWNEVNGFYIQGDVLTIDASQGVHDSIIYRIVIQNDHLFNLAAESGTISLNIQYGTVTFDATTCATSPNTPLLTPSVNCNKYNPRSHSRGIAITEISRLTNKLCIR